MVRIIQTIDQIEEFALRLQQRTPGADPDLLRAVAEIIATVRKGGDAALIQYSKKFDGHEITANEIRLDPDKLKSFAQGVDRDVLEVIRESIRNVTLYHQQQKESSWSIRHGETSELGQRILPLDSVGVYVPGGTAAYPSSVIMNVVPAQVAGVSRIAVATPPQTLSANPTVAAAILELGLTEVYAVGGAQAIALFAYGTETIEPVDKITGPGNKYVATAKRLVFGDVGIDAIAGPSEVVIVADDSCPAEFAAADMLAQAEHGPDASAVLVTTDPGFIARVAEEIEKQLVDLPRREIVREALSSFGAIISVPTISDAAEIVNRFAPEHVELITRDNNSVAGMIRHAGAIFFGPYSPEAVGDYFAGPNHVLPTGRTARFASALGVHDFVRRTSVIKYAATEMFANADKIAKFAEAEGLSGHARSVLVRK